MKLNLYYEGDRYEITSSTFDVYLVCTRYFKYDNSFEFDNFRGILPKNPKVMNAFLRAIDSELSYAADGVLAFYLKKFLKAELASRVTRAKPSLETVS